MPGMWVSFFPDDEFLEVVICDYDNWAGAWNSNPVPPDGCESPGDLFASAAGEDVLC
jgi:hypothetical protein